MVGRWLDPSRPRDAEKWLEACREPLPFTRLQWRRPDTLPVRPNLVVNPRVDEEFAEFARALAGNGADTAPKLEAALRRRYPKAGVRERTLSSEPIVTWYVYREGSWVPNE